MHLRQLNALKITDSKLACYANLLYDRLQQYLDFLIEKGYLRREVAESSQWYSLTGKGT